MKVIRQKSAPTISRTLQKVVVDSSDEVILDSNTSLKLPVGLDTNRPQTEENGQVRFVNTYPSWTPGDPVTGHYEAYHNGQWKELRFYEPREIYVQRFAADGILTQFGPLDNNLGGDSVNEFSYAGNPASILVFIENVYQIPSINYQIAQVGQDYFIDFGNGGQEPPPPSGKNITVLHNFDK